MSDSNRKKGVHVRREMRLARKIPNNPNKHRKRAVHRWAVAVLRVVRENEHE